MVCENSDNETGEKMPNSAFPLPGNCPISRRVPGVRFMSQRIRQEFDL
jgi:hypothetical protein